MKKLLIDCGSNLGQGFENLSQELNIDKNWEIIMFEPNHNCIDTLKNKTKNLNVTIYSKLVYIKNDYIEFNIPKNDITSVGATIHKDFHNSKYKIDYLPSIKIQSLDLSSFINDLVEDYEIYLKLDVEGSEYEILEKMIDDGTHLKLKKLYVEFHDLYSSEYNLKKFDLINRKMNILNEFSLSKIEYIIWE
jgi:hypothetical protein